MLNRYSVFLKNNSIAQVYGTGYFKDSDTVWFYYEDGNSKCFIAEFVRNQVDGIVLDRKEFD